MQKLKLFLASFGLLVSVAVPVMIPAVYADSADIQGNLCGSSSTIQINTGAGSTADCNDPSGGIGKVNTLLTTAVNVFSAVVGIVAVLMIIVGGLRYITSGGDTGKVSSAKTTIIYALVGLVVVALAQLIVHFVLAQAIGFTAGP